jgi:hypothetical protein
VAGCDAGQSLHDDPEVERDHQGDESVERHVDSELFTWCCERFRQHGSPLCVDRLQSITQVGTVPRERLELEPDLLVTDVLLDEEAHRRSPLLDERHVCGIHLALTCDEPLGEPLERANEDVLDRAEVVVDEAVVDARLLGEATGCDPGVTELNEKPLGRIEKSLLGGRAGCCFVDGVGQCTNGVGNQGGCANATAASPSSATPTIGVRAEP